MSLILLITWLWCGLACTTLVWTTLQHAASMLHATVGQALVCTGPNRSRRCAITSPILMITWLWCELAPLYSSTFYRLFVAASDLGDDVTDTAGTR